MERKGILIIGDIHGNIDFLKKIDYNDIDTILLTGDIAKCDKLRKISFEKKEEETTPQEIKNAYLQVFNSTKKILKYLSKKGKIYMIYGNVENYAGEEDKISKKTGHNFPKLKKLIKDIGNIRIINNRIAKVKGLKIGGLGFFNDINWVEEFQPEDYEESFLNALVQTKKIQKTLSWFDKLDILLTHQPPYVFCGHIHEAKGKKKLKKTMIYNLGEDNWMKI
ncbi:MAG: metallophosphoesterase family protein [Nanobdellota archaeon]